jgi:hypothetical protein
MWGSGVTRLSPFYALLPDLVGGDVSFFVVRAAGTILAYVRFCVN